MSPWNKPHAHFHENSFCGSGTLLKDIVTLESYWKAPKEAKKEAGFAYRSPEMHDRQALAYNSLK